MKMRWSAWDMEEKGHNSKYGLIKEEDVEKKQLEKRKEMIGSLTKDQKKALLKKLKKEEKKAKKKAKKEKKRSKKGKDSSDEDEDQD